jgi:hypothetical protein
VTPTNANAETTILDQAAVALMRSFALAYYFILQALVVAGALGVGVTAMRLRAIGSKVALLMVAVAAAVAVMARCILVAYIDATSFTATHMLYLVEASPFLLLFALVGAFLGLQSWSEMDARNAAARRAT